MTSLQELKAAVAAKPRVARAAKRSWLSLRLFGRALNRVWQRDAMLYVGGVSFFGLLAAVPAMSILVGTYGLFFSAEQATAQVAAVGDLMPPLARRVLENELARFPFGRSLTLSTQSVLAAFIAVYASHRSFKALISGLNLIHDEERPHSFVGFNLQALAVALAAVGLLIGTSVVFFGLRVAAALLSLDDHWLSNAWLWASVGLTGGLTLLYKYAMSRDRSPWRASLTGGVVAAALCLFASWASGAYVDFAQELGRTYGALGAAVVFLIWLSWNVNAVFIGGALATEVEYEICDQPRPASVSPTRRYTPRDPVGEDER